MKKELGLILGIVVILAFVAIIYFSGKISYTNDEAELRIEIKNQTRVCSIVFDDMWKIIKREAQIPEKYKDDFKEIILADNQAYGKDGIQIGGMFNTIQKVNPTFTTEMYKDLMRLVESEMKRFENEQKSLIALSERHEILIKTFPGNVYLSDIQPIEIKLITSSKTKKAYDAGEDDDVDLFDTSGKKYKLK